MVQVSLRQKIYQIIFGTDTPAGQYFDIALIYLILLSVLAIILDSIEAVNKQLWVVVVSSRVVFYSAIFRGVPGTNLFLTKTIALYF